MFSYDIKAGRENVIGSITIQRDGIKLTENTGRFCECATFAATTTVTHLKAPRDKPTPSNFNLTSLLNIEYSLLNILSASKKNPRQCDLAGRPHEIS